MRFAALEEKPAREIIADFKDEAIIAHVAPEITKGNLLGMDENLIKRKQMLRAIQ